MKRLFALPCTSGLGRSVTRSLAAASSCLLLIDQAYAQATLNNAPSTTAAAPASTASASLPSTGGSVVTMLLGLIAVLAVMAAVAWLLKRVGLTRALSGTSAARVIGGVSVGTRERVMVIEVGDQWIVVGVAPGRVNALTTMPRQEHVAAQMTPPAGPAFANWLKHTMDKRNGGASSGPRTGNDGSTQ
ncbi:flagellar biosynthetic protein FliO [Herbaspirillum sp. alder98]|uniref:flagellar biosynthetic protein FliO n=1 Tax=Herbaspirillum sp. alder98 TaxID=2913096 RepID=UPI001CD9110F|nr:flagellar biosynthetic protein FliO [Herbaspirillum sp. alder98]MCA1322597.1 flagellar biosynthetic protein FliO [Herbaspirillum sp. alder98]